MCGCVCGVCVGGVWVCVGVGCVCVCVKAHLYGCLTLNRRFAHVPKCTGLEANMRVFVT